MNSTGFWHTREHQISISQCPEGCIHLVVGRAIIKMTREEFLVLAKLTNTANREISLAEPRLVSKLGH